MDDKLGDFLRALIGAGWNTTLREDRIAVLDNHILRRYPAIPNGYLAFLNQVDSCMNQDATAWFLCANDYNGKSNSAFPWNEYEAQSLTAAGNDLKWRRQIITFWNEHFPIALSVKSEYQYLCIDLTPDQYGAIAYGHEPEFEEIEIVCDNFDQLTGLFASALTNGSEHPLLSAFL